MDDDDPLQRLQSLQRDLIAFVEARLPNIDRLSAELDASLDDLRKLFDKKPKNEASRQRIVSNTGPSPTAVTVNDVEYELNEDFRQAVLLVADELNLDEVDAAKLCLEATSTDYTNTGLAYRAIVRFHEHRRSGLLCLQLLLHYTVELNEDNDVSSHFRNFLAQVTRTLGKESYDFSAFWDKCLAGLTDIEAAIRKVEEHKQAILITNQIPTGDHSEALRAQRILLTFEHEALTACMAQFIRGNYVSHQGFRSFISKAAALETAFDLTIHYLPVIISGSAYFGAGDNTPLDAALDLHKLFAAGPAQMQYRQLQLQAAATICWLAEYSARFTDTLADPLLRVADRQKAEEDRTLLFFDAVKRKGMHFLLSACTYLQAEVWHNPARQGLVEYLLGETQRAASDAPKPSTDYVKVAMRELQSYTEAFVSHMPDVLRRLRSREDDQRRDNYSRPQSEAHTYEPDLERFIVIMSYAYQDDAEAAQDFWQDREGNLYGFLKWVSQRLPTPRVAAFCDLLGSIATDTKTANHVHRFLLEDTVMMSGKLRKAYNVSWSQIFGELETFANSLKGRPAIATSGTSEVHSVDFMEGETSIMLEAYLRLATHVCVMSPEARNWILREQNFQLAEILFQLASSSVEPRIQACCFNLLEALLTEKIAEVNDGMWVMLDSWITGSAANGLSGQRQAVLGKSTSPEKYYLHRFSDNPETATAFISLLNALIAPVVNGSESALGALPFPENLGSPQRHAGIDAYIDFALGTAFRNSSLHVTNGYDDGYVHMVRCAALGTIVLCLNSFKEDLVLLANTTSVSVDSVVQCSSLAAYIRLHPFARVMDWLLNKNVIDVLAASIQRFDLDLDELDSQSPRVLAATRGVQALNAALKLQATYFDIVKPILRASTTTGANQISNSAFGSVDEVILSQLPMVVDVVSYTTSSHLDLSVNCVELLQALAESRKLSNDAYHNVVGTRLTHLLSDDADAIAASLRADFEIYEHDVELSVMPPKLTRASAILDLLKRTLNASTTRPGIAHCLLGFVTTDSGKTLTPGDLFAQDSSLFHAIMACAVQGPISIAPANISWLLKIKRGCYEVIASLASSPLTAIHVIPELRSHEFLQSCAGTLVAASINPFWDTHTLSEPELLLDTAGQAVEDFIRIREIYFIYASIELQIAIESKAYSVVEKNMQALRGKVVPPTGGQLDVLTVFDLFDFFDMDTSPASDVASRFLAGIDLSVCLKDAGRLGTTYSKSMVEELLILKRREIVLEGLVKDSNDEQQLDDEIQATLASVQSQDTWTAIQIARLGALEAWCNLLAVMITAGGLDNIDVPAFARQTLQVTLPHFERCLPCDMEATLLLARLTLIMVPAVFPADGTEALDSTFAAHERLLLAFRVCLKALTDSNSDVALRGLCYRTSCVVLNSIPLTIVNGKVSPSTNARQLLQLVHLAGERLFNVIVQDAFADQGSTRVSAIMCLDALVVLFQNTRSNAQLLKTLSKLNFVPILIDSSIGSIATSLQNKSDELRNTVSYFHTAVSLLLRLCQTSEGAQLVLQSGFYDAVTESRLFSTDPDIGLDIDNPTALKQFYMLLSAVLRVIVTIVVARGPSNLTTIQQAKTFLQQNRFSMQAVFKRTSAVQKTAGPPEPEAIAVAEEFSRLILVTGFLEDDEPQHQRLAKINGFS